MENLDGMIARGGMICYNSLASRICMFKSGGAIRTLAQPYTYEAAVYALENLKCRVVGACTNTLISDAGYDNPLISMRKFVGCEILSDGIVANAGEPLAAISAAAQRNGLSGMEGMCSIPGTVGGALAMNAGAYGCFMSDIAEWAEVYTPQGTEIWTNAQMRFSYRDSVFQKPETVVLRVKLKLRKNTKTAIARAMKENSELRRKHQPTEPSLGCVFRKFDGKSAGEYIESAGLKGYTVGGAQISPMHANFIVNIGGGTSSDYAALARYAAQAVEERFGVKLQREVKYLGYGLE